jgi:hypothetical protein
MKQRVEMKPLLPVTAAFMAVALAAGGGAGQGLVREDHAIEVDVASTWTYTDVFLFEGDTVFVLAKGTISISGPGSDSWQDWSGPEGASPSQAGGCTDCPLPGFRSGALIARIGAGPAFHIGSFCAFVCDTSGVLQFGVNENDASDNRGDLLAFVWREYGPVAPTDAEAFSMSAFAREDGIVISWQAYTGQPVQGYRLYRREPGKPEISLNDEYMDQWTQQYVDNTARQGVIYEYALGVVLEDGSEVLSPWTRATSALPGLALYQNYPNPFNPVTKIGFSIPQKTLVRITIYDAAGRRVRLLADSSYPAGPHSIQWDGRNDQGRRVASGVYFYNLDADRTRLSRKMILLR